MIFRFLINRASTLFLAATVFSLQGSLVFAQTETGASATVSEGQITVPLSGRGLVSRISNLSVSPNLLDLGSVEIGTSRTMTVVLSHTGDADSPAIEIGGVSLLGDAAEEYSFSGFRGNQQLRAGDSVDIEITLSPDFSGEKSAALQLEVVGSTSPFVLLLDGSAQFALASNLTVSENIVDFGRVIVGEQASVSVLLTNDGDAQAPVINVTGIQLGGADAEAFNVASTGISLSPGETFELVIAANSNQIGTKNATLEISHDGNNRARNVELRMRVCDVNSCNVSFSQSSVESDVDLAGATTLQFGPGGLLYVGQLDGDIMVLDVSRQGSDDYEATFVEEIGVIRETLNHNDDGTRDFGDKRLVTGIHVTGTAANPVIYAGSSDPRQAAGPSDIPGGNDIGLDTNSGILHELTRGNDGVWTKIDLVRGLPRSEENHVLNGLVKVGNKIYLNVGGNTNEGMPSTNFATLDEYALSAAVLEIDLDMIGGVTYDIPTLDGPGDADDFDPFGGHDGLNQAMLVENGPIKLFATGLRNAYDIVYTEAGRFYVWDNGPDTGWGGIPDSDCVSEFNDEGIDAFDGLHLIAQDYYAGHPNPIRGNKNNTFGGQSPIEGDANPIECIYLSPANADDPIGESGALTFNSDSTNGLAEYTASNFDGEMQNDLLAVTLGNQLLRVGLNASGDVAISQEALVSGVGSSPLDVTTQSDDGEFPGTIWIADLFEAQLIVLEPADF